MNETTPVLSEWIRDIPDFPKPGVVFKDITPLLGNAEALAESVQQLAGPFRGVQIDSLVAVEARGFLFGAPLAIELGVGMVPVRKAGKLPGEIRRFDYDLEYGSDALEIHIDSIGPGDRVLVVDDLLATGGTVQACCELLEQCGAVVIGCAFLIDLTFLKGAERLAPRNIFSVIQY
jgi:adenine phosphoribosyltransferase